MLIIRSFFCVFFSLVFIASGAIRSGDVLVLTIKGVPVGEKGTIDGEYVVGKDGQIKIPLADVMVKARGLEHEQLARSVENVFKKAGIYMRPTITVRSNAETPGDRSLVSVGGRVRRAGPVPFREGITLLQAIQAAGDLDQFGTKKRIFLTRGKQAWRLDLRKPEHQQFKLEAEDTIVVDQKRPFDAE
ncbi:SLBB domain-containing protein [Akkermansiaceae bacterium]|nr:SLBB domain-containing protein [Akkermansiaceae bacterium]